MELSDSLIGLVTEHGITAPIAAVLFLGLYIYERRARDADRKAYDAALKASTDENTETLKLVIPLVQKLTATMDVTLPILIAKIDRGDR